MKTYIDNVLKEVDRIVNKYPWDDSKELFKSELLILLDQQRKELVKKLKGEKIHITEEDYELKEIVPGYKQTKHEVVSNIAQYLSHNQALDRAIEIIRESK